VTHSNHKIRNDQRWCVGIVVPAHNEESLVARCLHSLIALQTDIPYWIVLVADRCSDRTRHIGEQILRGRGEVVSSFAGNVGAARDLGSRVAVQHLAQLHPNSRIWLANTDADGFVPSTWIDQQVVVANTGAHAVAGVVDLDDSAYSTSAFRCAFRTSYGVAQHGEHPHVQGANLGLCARALREVGGWSGLANGEDRELWNRLGASGFVRVSDAAIRVTTSSRLDGKVAGGFSHSLRLLIDDNAQLAS
jgi:glycosyltransferase involved in cell wall biosynthesis